MVLSSSAAVSLIFSLIAVEKEATMASVSEERSLNVLVQPLHQKLVV